MKSLILASALFSGVASAQCFGPVCMPAQPVEPTGPAELCLPSGCSPVFYHQINRFVIAESVLPSTQYAVIGWSGPCLDAVCPDIKNQAFADLELNAKRANRAQRF